MENNFDKTAPFYDFIARLVYGRSIQEIQKTYLNKIPNNSRILIIGGGTGWILHEIMKGTSPEKIVYIEKSLTMIKQTEYTIREAPWKDKILLCHRTDKSLLENEYFDVIITHFFLDMFIDKELTALVNSLHRTLKCNGLWLYCDFYNTGKIIHKVLLWTMYCFFKVTANIAVMKLDNPKV